MASKTPQAGAHRLRQMLRPRDTLVEFALGANGVRFNRKQRRTHDAIRRWAKKNEPANG